MCVCVQVKIWDIPSQGVQQNITVARKTLIGHSKRVGLIEWHPTARDLLVSSAYDYKVRITHTHTRMNTHMNTRSIVLFPLPLSSLSSPSTPLSPSPLQVMVWDVSQDGRVLRPVRQLQTPELLLSVSLSRDGRWLACCCRDRRLRVLEPRSGRILQVGLAPPTVCVSGLSVCVICVCGCVGVCVGVAQALPPGH